MNFGLLGRTLGHSFSPAIHAQIGDYAYQLFEKEPEELDDFFAHGDWQGLNVTIPYKETVLPYLTSIDPNAARIGCVNTIVRKKDGLHGYNTDYDGLSFAMDNAGIEINGRKCLILGNGATSKTIHTVLSDKGAREILTIARHDGIPYSDIHLHHDAEIIVNATPVGMYPHNLERLISLDGFTKLEACFDVIYNPRRSQFLLDAMDRGVKVCDGLPMLVAQAVYAAKHFIGLEDVIEPIARILAKMTADDENIVLIGMPGVGKTTVGNALSQSLGRTLIDSDEVFAKEIGPVADYIEIHGAPAFREKECEVIARLGQGHGQIIATGGGVVTQAQNYDALRQNGRIYWLTRPLEALATDGRPLSKGGMETLEKLYSERADLYAAFADRAIENTTPEDAARLIEEDFYEAMRH